MPNKKYPYQNRSLKDMKDEEWEDIPFLDGAYQISNFGRIKALRRWVERGANGGYWSSEKILASRVLTQYVSNRKRKLYRLAVQISFEQKKYSVYIARMVYFLFVKKFKLEDRSLFVSYKDGDAFNIHPQNLILTTPSASITKAYQKNHRERESFGNLAQTVTQFDVSGKKINTYPSLSAAANAIGVSPAALSDILRKQDGFGVGYIWRYGNRDKQLLRIPKSIKRIVEWKQLHNTVITQYDLKGKKIKEHSNIRAAARAMKSQTSLITNAVLGKTNTSKGYYWKLGKGPNRIDIQPILEKRLEKLRNSVCRPVTQFNLEGKKINTYRSIAEAARAMCVSNMGIHHALKYNKA